MAHFKIQDSLTLQISKEMKLREQQKHSSFSDFRYMLFHKNSANKKVARLRNGFYGVTGHSLLVMQYSCGEFILYFHFLRIVIKWGKREIRRKLRILKNECVSNGLRYSLTIFGLEFIDIELIFHDYVRTRHL